jgi:hypothetical protein
MECKPPVFDARNKTPTDWLLGTITIGAYNYWRVVKEMDRYNAERTEWVKCVIRQTEENLSTQLHSVRR